MTMKIIIIGASGGIGQAFVKCYKEQYNDAELFELSRSQTGFDLTDENSIKQAAGKFQDRNIDMIIVATGFLGTEPEKSLRDLSMEKMERVFQINTFGPALVMKHFIPKLARDRKSVFAALSARVGSIGDNHLGGWYAYRASKSALNMMIRSASIEVARTNKNAAVIGLHPGTVDTSLSKPFQSNVPDKKLFIPDDSAFQMLKVIHDIDPKDTGHIFAYDGEKLVY